MVECNFNNNFKVQKSISNFTKPYILLYSLYGLNNPQICVKFQQYHFTAIVFKKKLFTLQNFKSAS